LRSECLPITKLPHVTRLFTDYVGDPAKLSSFLPVLPVALSTIPAKTLDETVYPKERRERVAAVLERQNRGWNAPSATLSHIARLRQGAMCAVTGQQVGVFGGPSYSLFKALTVLKAAAQATAAGVDCVPVFWLATEDHDLEEVDHAVVPAGDGTLHRLSMRSSAAEGAPMRDIRLGEDITAVLARMRELLGGDVEALQALSEAYRPGESLGGAFARLFTTLFGRWGLVLLDASDQELHDIAQPVYRAAIERAEEIDQALLARGKQLTAAGYHEQVKVTDRTTLLFAEQHGVRTVIRRGSDGQADFRIGTERIARPALLQRIAEEPARFSPNVLLRPVVQDFLLPTAVYSGGPAEVAYFAQVAVVYEKLLGRATPILPRFSATLVEEKSAKLLRRYQLGIEDVLQGPENVRRRVADRAMAPRLHAAFQEAEGSLAASLAELQRELEKLDSTLADAARHAGSKMKYQLERLRARAEAAELRRSEVLERHAAYLNSLLFPNQDLQERQLAGIYFLARHGMDVLASLYEQVGQGCPDHQVVFL
jgi:bacillithiol synthase